MFKRVLLVMAITSTAALAQQPAAPVIDPSPALSVLQADFQRVTQDINAVLLENQNKITALQKQADDLKAYWAGWVAGETGATGIKPKP